MSDRIHLSSPDVGEAEEAALVRAIRSGWVAPLGPEVDAFETELAAYCGRGHAVALSSGTAALHLGLLTLGVGPGTAVLTSTMTFAATANAITYTGAQPVFVDCDETGNMSPDLLDQAFDAVAADVTEVDVDVREPVGPEPSAGVRADVTQHRGRSVTGLAESQQEANEGAFDDRADGEALGSREPGGRRIVVLVLDDGQCDEGVGVKQERRHCSSTASATSESVIRRPTDSVGSPVRSSVASRTGVSNCARPRTVRSAMTDERDWPRSFASSRARR